MPKKTMKIRGRKGTSKLGRISNLRKGSTSRGRKSSKRTSS